MFYIIVLYNLCLNRFIIHTSNSSKYKNCLSFFRFSDLLWRWTRPLTLRNASPDIYPQLLYFLFASKPGDKRGFLLSTSDDTRRLTLFPTDVAVNMSCTGSSVFAAVVRAVWRASANVGEVGWESVSAVTRQRHKSCCWSLTFFLQSGSMFSRVFVIVGNLRKLGTETSSKTLTGGQYFTV